MTAYSVADAFALFSFVDPTKPVFEATIAVELEEHASTADEKLKLSAFYIPPASSSPLQFGSFTCAVSHGAGCNCYSIQLCPHGNGSHSEGFGHVLHDYSLFPIHKTLTDADKIIFPVVLLSVDPERKSSSSDWCCPVSQDDDLIITRSALETALNSVTSQSHHLLERIKPRGICVRTVDHFDRENMDHPHQAHHPHNPHLKLDADDLLHHHHYRQHDLHPLRKRNWSGSNPVYFSVDAALWMASRFSHLICDLPSVDREDDGGLLLGHKAFFGMLPEQIIHLSPHDRAQLTRQQLPNDDPHTFLSHPRRSSTISELCCFPNSTILPDDVYAVMLQISPIASDAAPCRPLILSLKK